MIPCCSNEKSQILPFVSFDSSRQSTSFLVLSVVGSYQRAESYRYSPMLLTVLHLSALPRTVSTEYPSHNHYNTERRNIRTLSFEYLKKVIYIFCSKWSPRQSPLYCMTALNHSV